MKSYEYEILSILNKVYQTPHGLYYQQVCQPFFFGLFTLQNGCPVGLTKDEERTNICLKKTVQRNANCYYFSLNLH